MVAEVMGGLNRAGTDSYWVAGAAVDFRCGADRLLMHVREMLGRDPLDGSAFVFRNRRSNRIKVLRVDAQGVWLATRRLHEGRFRWVSAHESLASLTRRQFHWLCAGVDWQRLSASLPLEKCV
jgi:transposase